MISQWVELRGRLQLAIQNAEQLNPDAGNTIVDAFDDVFAFIDNEIEQAMPTLLVKKQTI